MRHGRLGLFLRVCIAVLLLDGGCSGMAGRFGKDRAVSSAPASQPAAVDWQGPIEVRGVERTYLLHLPASYDSARPVPLVLVFHGGRGSGKQIARYTNFSQLADQKGFIVAYPDGLDGHWNDGRPRSNPDEPAPDDVAFVSTLIDHLGTLFSIDRKRVFATGISNGAIFVQRLGCELPDKLAAIAPVAGTLAKDQASRGKPSQPVSVLMIHGTADEFVPYGGGEVRGDIHGQVLSVKDTIALWRTADGCGKPPSATTLPAGSAGGPRVQCQTWTGKGATAVVLYTIEGGGHTWPGVRVGHVAGRILGPVSQDFNAARTIWEFFELHPRLN
jgi:polyhydroxybutyrate depolymerase